MRADREAGGPWTRLSALPRGAACPLRGSGPAFLDVLLGQVEAECVIQRVEVQLELADQLGMVQLGAADGLVEEVELAAPVVGGAAPPVPDQFQDPQPSSRRRPSRV